MNQEAQSLILNNRCRIILSTQKGTITLTTTHYCPAKLLGTSTVEVPFMVCATQISDEAGGIVVKNASLAGFRLFRVFGTV